MLAEYEGALQLAFTAGADARRRAKEAAGRAAQDALALMQAYAHGAEMFASGDADAALALQRHVLRTAGALRSVFGASHIRDCAHAWFPVGLPLTTTALNMLDLTVTSYVTIETEAPSC